jgi:hypothetical protein
MQGQRPKPSSSPSRKKRQKKKQQPKTQPPQMPSGFSPCNNASAAASKPPSVLHPLPLQPSDTNDKNNEEEEEEEETFRDRMRRLVHENRMDFHIIIAFILVGMLTGAIFLVETAFGQWWATKDEEAAGEYRRQVIIYGIMLAATTGVVFVYLGLKACWFLEVCKRLPRIMSSSSSTSRVLFGRKEEEGGGGGGEQLAVVKVEPAGTSNAKEEEAEGEDDQQEDNASTPLLTPPPPPAATVAKPPERAPNAALALLF